MSSIKKKKKNDLFLKCSLLYSLVITYLSSSTPLDNSRQLPRLLPQALSYSYPAP